MKPRTIIILGLLVLIVLLGVWVYVFFGAPKDGEPGWGIFPTGDEEGPGMVVPPTPPPPVVNMERPRLRQLTTRPVAGFREISKIGQDTPYIYYVEAGDGYVFEIDLITGEERRLSNYVAKDRASSASISPDGRFVAIKSNNQRRFNSLEIIDTTNESDPLKKVLEENVGAFSIVDKNQLLYTTPKPAGLSALAYNLETGSSSQLFTLPFYDVRVNWGTTSTSTHYVTNRPSFLLEGYLFSLKNGQLKREPAQGFGLTTIETPDYIFASFLKSGQFHNQIIKRRDGTASQSNFRFLPEKCAPSSKTPGVIWCAYQEMTVPQDFPDNWYRGELGFADTIWQYDATISSTMMLVDPLAEVGREIDITDINIGESEYALYFINKNDNTLWMYEL